VQAAFAERCEAAQLREARPRRHCAMLRDTGSLRGQAGKMRASRKRQAAAHATLCSRIRSATPTRMSRGAARETRAAFQAARCSASQQARRRFRPCKCAPAQAQRCKMRRFPAGRLPRFSSSGAYRGVKSRSAPLLHRTSSHEARQCHSRGCAPFLLLWQRVFLLRSRPWRFGSSARAPQPSLLLRTASTCKRHRACAARLAPLRSRFFMHATVHFSL